MKKVPKKKYSTKTFGDYSHTLEVLVLKINEESFKVMKKTQGFNISQSTLIHFPAFFVNCREIRNSKNWSASWSIAH